MRLLPLTRRGTLSLAAALALPRGSRAQPGPGRFTTLAYHEVGADGGGRHYSISESTMVQHLAFLRQDGWHFVSLDDVLAARDGRRPLPDKSVLLTFDDGYDDYHTRVFPMLRAFRAPGVFALVTSWMETPPGGHFDYGGTAKPRSALMSWAQAREMQASGLCEFASHSHDLHRAVRGNPQGNTQPAAVTRIWDGGYETDTAWTRRIEADLRRSAEIMARHLGRRPRCIVWPYGRHNDAAIGIARRLGMPVTMTLDPEPGRVERTAAIGRLLTMGDPRVADLERMMRFDAPVRERVLRIALDDLHDADEDQTARNVDALVARVARLGPSHVHLRAIADPGGTGVAQALYFPGRHLPMRADLFNRVAWQLMTRAGVKVFASLPLLAYHFGGGADLLRPAGHDAPDTALPRRLSPFSARARDGVGEIVEDLAKHAAFDGLLFEEDGVLTASEQSGTEPATSTLIRLTQDLAARARQWRAPLRLARTLHPAALLVPGAEARFAQSLPAFLGAYDRTIIRAAPAGDAEARLRQVFARIAAQPGGIAGSVVMVPARQQDGRALPAASLRAQLRLLQRLGAHHMGWEGDDARRGLPEAEVVMDAISARSFPWQR